MFPQLVEGDPHGGPHHGGVAAVAEGVGLSAHHNVHPPVLLIERGPDHLEHTPIVPHQAVHHFPGAFQVVCRGVGGEHSSRVGGHAGVRLESPPTNIDVSSD